MINWICFRLLDLAAWKWGVDAVTLWFVDHFRALGYPQQADEILLGFHRRWGEFPIRDGEAVPEDGADAAQPGPPEAQTKP